MSLLKGVIIDIESTATKAVNAAAVQTELSQIIEDIADCIDNAFTCTDLDSTYESDQVEKLINALTTSTKAAKMNAQVVLQLSQAALSSASDAVYTEDDQKTLSKSAAAGLTEKETKDELDFCNDGSNPRHCIECGKCVLFHNNVICQSCQNIIKNNKENPQLTQSQQMQDRIKKTIIKNNKEKPPPHDKDCSNRWLADWTIHEYAGDISESCTRCKIAIKHNQEKVTDGPIAGYDANSILDFLIKKYTKQLKNMLNKSGSYPDETINSTTESKYNTLNSVIKDLEFMKIPNPKDESKRCTECGRWLIRFMSCQECKLIMDEQDGIWSCSECDAQVCYDDGSDYADCGHLAFSEHHLENMCNCELDK